MLAVWGRLGSKWFENRLILHGFPDWPGPGKVASLDLAIRIDMGSHMKTTVDIADSVLLRAKALAEASGTTLRRLIEEGLRKLLEEAEASQTREIEWVTFSGEGLHAEFRDKDWAGIRDAIYRSDPTSS